jgi:hypothetical protein
VLILDIVFHTLNFMPYFFHHDHYYLPITTH